MVRPYPRLPQHTLYAASSDATVLMNEMWPLALLIPVILLVGVLIGSIGIGGVLLVPALSYVAGIEIHIAIAACMLSYAFSGAVGAYIYAKHGTIRWATGLWLCLGAMPGAYAGALVVASMPARTITLIIGLFIVFASVQALRKPREIDPEKQTQSTRLLMVIGAVVGFGSSLSTGGPLLLVPLLVWLNWPVLSAVGLSQIIQLPISALATLGNYLHGEIDLTLALGIAVIMIFGVAIGARVAHLLPALLLQRFVALVLAVVGVSMLGKSLSYGVA